MHPYVLEKTRGRGLPRELRRLAHCSGLGRESEGEVALLAGEVLISLESLDPSLISLGYQRAEKVRVSSKEDLVGSAPGKRRRGISRRRW